MGVILIEGVGVTCKFSQVQLSSKVVLTPYLSDGNIMIKLYSAYMFRGGEIT